MLFFAQSRGSGHFATFTQMEINLHVVSLHPGV